MTPPPASGPRYVPARPAGRTPRPTLARMHRRRRRSVLLGLLLVVAGTVMVALLNGGDDAPRAYTPAAGPGSQKSAPGAGVGNRTASSAYPTAGAGSFTPADGGSPVHGAGGPLRRYRITVESGTGQNADAFAATVDAVLADPRGWTALGEFRVQRVVEAAAADFTVYLATPATSERMCAEGGLSTERYASCRLPGQVIINLERWMEAVPDYGAPLAVYRAYVINHEVGHEFGSGHEACPGPGRPAPVMQQQTYGLQGCVANPWPYLDGRRYAGDIIP